MTDLPFRSAGDLAAAIKGGEISSRELTELYIERIEAFDDRTNAMVVRCFDQALQDAEEADRALAQGRDLGPLHGVPVSIKDSFDLAGAPTTWGVTEFTGNIADEDSDVVARMRASGAHYLGKTNVPYQLADFQSYNEFYGTTNNPWDLKLTPGGSSGGSAAALAVGFTALEAGSDIGGSIRNPAHYCGVYGHKPTWGVVSDRGHALPGMFAPADIAVVGPLARSADDLALAMDITAGASGFLRGWKLDLRRPTKTSLSEYRIAVWPGDDVLVTSTEVSDRVAEVAATLSELGATVSDTARPPFADYGLSVEDVLETYQSLLWGVMAEGYPDDRYKELVAEAANLDPGDRRLKSQFLRSSVQDHRFWAFHDNRRFLVRRIWDQFFADWDILICPQMPTTAFEQDQAPYWERTLTFDETTIDYVEQINWSGLITVAHLPSTVFPTGLSAKGLPIGLQAVGREYDDYLTIDFARLMAREIGGFVPPPDFS